MKTQHLLPRRRTGGNGRRTSCRCQWIGALDSVGWSWPAGALLQRHRSAWPTAEVALLQPSAKVVLAKPRGRRQLRKVVRLEPPIRDAAEHWKQPISQFHHRPRVGPIRL